MLGKGHHLEHGPAITSTSKTRISSSLSSRADQLQSLDIQKWVKIAAQLHGDLSSGWLSPTTKEIHLVNKHDKTLLIEEDGRKNEGEEEGTTRRRGKERNEGGQ